MNPDPDDVMHEQDQRIADVLRREFAPPPAAVLGRLVPVARPRARVLAYALSLAALLLVALALVLRPRAPQAVDPATLPAMWVAAYHDAVTRGFGTSNCCDGDCDLQTRCRQMFATALGVEDGADVELCGAYCGLPAGGAVTMLARAGTEQEPVCMFVLPRAKAPRGRIGDVAGLRIHRREVGDLVVFELSRLPDARVLPHLYVPEG
jgi:hypothetical protein